MSYLQLYIPLLIIFWLSFITLIYLRQIYKQKNETNLTLSFSENISIIIKQYGGYSLVNRLAILCGIIILTIIGFMLSNATNQIVDPSKHSQIHNFLTINIANLLTLFLSFCLLINNKIRWQLKITKEISQLLNIIYILTNTGRNIDYILNQISLLFAKQNYVIADDFIWLINEIKYNSSRDLVWDKLKARLGYSRISFFTLLLKKNKIFDLELVANLREQRDIVAEEYLIQIESYANKTSIYLIFIFVFFLLPPFFITATGPAFINIMRTFGIF